jgi:hypothetical protein
LRFTVDVFLLQFQLNFNLLWAPLCLRLDFS